MKTGITVQELATEIRRQQEVSQDYISPTKRMTMAPGNGHGPIIAMGDEGEFGIQRYAHRQIGEHLHIPVRYYDRMVTEAPHLLAENVNHWLQRSDDIRLVRTLDDEIRAYLSNAYRPMDNAELAEAVLPAIQAAAPPRGGHPPPP